jgi:hypothetical protein
LLNYEEMVNTINNIDLNNKTIYNINKKKDWFIRKFMINY